jgi:hypothetical protein
MILPHDHTKNAMILKDPCMWKEAFTRTDCSDSHLCVPDPNDWNRDQLILERRSGRTPGARILIPPGYLHLGKQKH